jgi:phospholipid N-methyltransferase
MKNLSPEVIDVLKNRLIIKGHQVTMPQLDRKLYEQVNRALVLLGGKWMRSAKAHVFETDPTAAIAAAFGTGKVRDEKQEFQFFPTPHGLAMKMARFADIQNGESVLEPSAGHGALIDAAMEFGAKRALLPQQFFICELNPKWQAVLKRKGYTKIIADDFLTITREDSRFRKGFDKIIANPPFTRNQDIDHIRHMYDMLAPGGRLVTLSSRSWTTGTQKKQVAFREWLDEVYASQHMVPSGTFADTQIATVIIAINKPKTALEQFVEKQSKQSPVTVTFTAPCVFQPKLL